MRSRKTDQSGNFERKADDKDKGLRYQNRTPATIKMGGFYQKVQARARGESSTKMRRGLGGDSSIFSVTPVSRMRVASRKRNKKGNYSMEFESYMQSAMNSGSPGDQNMFYYTKYGRIVSEINEETPQTKASNENKDHQQKNDYKWILKRRKRKKRESDRVKLSQSLDMPAINGQAVIQRKDPETREAKDRKYMSRSRGRKKSFMEMAQAVSDADHRKNHRVGTTSLSRQRKKVVKRMDADQYLKGVSLGRSTSTQTSPPNPPQQQRERGYLLLDRPSPSIKAGGMLVTEPPRPRVRNAPRKKSGNKAKKRPEDIFYFKDRFKNLNPAKPLSAKEM